MNEDYVSKELARKLQEKGYPLKKVYRQDGAPLFYDLPQEHPDWSQCDAWYIPSIWEALKWLREVKKIHVTTGVTPKSSWRYIIMFCDERGLQEPTITVKNYTNYSSAISAGIEYVLDNLI